MAPASTINSIIFLARPTPMHVQTDVTLGIGAISVYEPLVFIRAHIRRLGGGHEAVGPHYGPGLQASRPPANPTFFTPGRKPSSRVGSWWGATATDQSDVIGFTNGSSFHSEGVTR
jgi:hypothetical protein